MMANLRTKVLYFVYNMYGIRWFARSNLFNLLPQDLKKPPDKLSIKKLIDNLCLEGYLQKRPGKGGLYYRISKKGILYMRNR